MAPTLYMVPASPPVRAVLMTAQAIGLNLDLKEINLQNGDHKTPEFHKLNPQHTVPTFVDDDGFAIWDSHAIMSYIITQYAKDDSLYPKDPRKRAIIDQRLHFESGVVFARAFKILRPMVKKHKVTVDQEDVEAIEEIYGFLETFLEGNQWMAGNSITIADFSLLAGVSSLDVLHRINPAKFPNVMSWLNRAESLPVYEVNKKGLQGFEALVKAYLT